MRHRPREPRAGIRQDARCDTPGHGSPYIAGFIQTTIATIIAFWFFLTDRDPYRQLDALMASLERTAILIVQALAAFSAVAYVHAHKKHPGDGSLVPHPCGARRRRGRNARRDLPAHRERQLPCWAAASDIVFKMVPWLVPLFGLGDIACALFAKYFAPERYDIIGRVVLEETHARDLV